MSAEEAEGVEYSQYSGEGSPCWFGITVSFERKLFRFFTNITYLSCLTFSTTQEGNTVAKIL